MGPAKGGYLILVQDPQIPWSESENGGAPIL